MSIFGKKIERPSWMPRWMSLTLVLYIFMNGTHFPARGLFINVNLMAQREKLRPDLVTGRTGPVVNVIAVRPGEHPLFDVKPHKTASFGDKDITVPPPMQAKPSATAG